MNVKRAKKPEARVEVKYSSQLRMQMYGNDNLYPQNVMAITNASGTATLCLNRYAKFVEGFGFHNDALANYELNRDGETADVILRSVVKDLTTFGGFALHVNYDVLGRIVEINPVPFENCRLEEEDDAGIVQHILIHPDWSGKKTRNGRTVIVKESNVDKINVYNPDPEVVRSQIEAVGGIDNYKGQVLWCSMCGKYQYPTPIYDSIITDISTDEGLGNIKNRNTRNNFLVACMLVAKKGLPRMKEGKNGEQIEEERQMIADEDLVKFQGDTNGSKILYVELENDEDEPKIVPFPVRNYDKEFSVTDASIIERIYAQFHQELFHAIRIGKVGFSGQTMEDAYRYYAGEVTTEQRLISRSFAQIFAHWHDELLHNADLEIQPLKYISAESNG